MNITQSVKQCKYAVNPSVSDVQAFANFRFYTVCLFSAAQETTLLRMLIKIIRLKFLALEIISLFEQFLMTCKHLLGKCLFLPIGQRYIPSG